MAKDLDYHSREYDELVRQARRIGWNDDELSSDERQKEIDDFSRSLDRRFNASEDVDRVKKISRGERW